MCIGMRNSECGSERTEAGIPPSEFRILYSYLSA
jgi:hypothetical protein